MPAALRKYRVTVVSSDDDPYAPVTYTAACVAAWGAGPGDWAEGWAIVNRWRSE